MDAAEIQRRIDRLAAEFREPDPETQPELADYQDYLASKLWARIRKRVLRRDAGLCRRCGGHGRQCHHRSYDVDVLRGERIEPIVTVCDGCHAVIERDAQGFKRDMAEKDRVLFDLSEGVDLPEPQLDRRGNPVPPPELDRATAIQRLLWRCAAARRKDHEHIRKALARPSSGVKQRHPLCPHLEMGDVEGDGSSDILLEEVRFHRRGVLVPCWCVGRFVSPEDGAWIDISLDQRARAGALRTLAGRWPLGVRTHVVGLTPPLEGRIRLLRTDGRTVLAERWFRIGVLPDTS